MEIRPARVALPRAGGGEAYIKVFARPASPWHWLLTGRIWRPLGPCMLSESRRKRRRISAVLLYDRRPPAPWRHRMRPWHLPVVRRRLLKRAWLVQRLHLGPRHPAISRCCSLRQPRSPAARRVKALVFT